MRKSKMLKKRSGRALALALSASMAISGSGFTALAAEDEEDGADSGAITRSYGDFDFVKTSNPTAGPKEADGINTNDLSGFEANRLNSYAWAVASRGDYIYIGTNRTLFGSALNAVTETLQSQNPDMSVEAIKSALSVISGGDVPIDLEEKDYIPQIIRFDVKNGTTKVIYQPETAVGDDNRLYYTDKNGEIIEAADVASETASFRSVIEYNGNLYFGSLGTNMLQLVRVDEEDNAEVVFQTIGLVSSLRAGCVYDDGDCETVYFGGQDTTYAPWRKYKMEHQGEAAPLPIVIRYLDPDTAGTEAEDWSGLVADYNDFGKYSYANVYVAGGGTVWDLVSYNGKLYLILAYDGGWAMFRGEKGGDNPNQFGWTWTEIVGDDGKYPLAMDAEVAELNAQYQQDYGCSEFNPNSLNGGGLLESTATPYVYNGKMYIGSFDNSTTLQSQTVIKGLIKLMALKNIDEDGSTGPTFAQIYAPIYEALTHQQHVWVMDENEEITAVDGANDLLAGTTNDYVWRFIDYKDKLYMGTFDSSSAYIYFLDFNMGRVLSYLEQNKEQLAEELQDLIEGALSQKLQEFLEDAEAFDVDEAGLLQKIIDAVEKIEEFLRGEAPVEEVIPKMEELNAISDADWNAVFGETEAELNDLYEDDPIDDDDDDDDDDEYPDWETIKEQIAELKAKAAELMAEAEALAKEAVEKATQEASDWIKDVMENTDEKVAEIKAKAEEYIAEAKAQAEEMIEQAKIKAAELIEQAKQYAGDKAEEFKEKAEELIAQAEADAKEAIDEATATATEWINNVMDEANAKIAEVKAKAEEYIAQAKAQAEEMIEQAKVQADEFLEQAKQFALEKAEEIKAKLIELQAEIQETKRVVTWLVNYFDIEGLTYWAKARAIAKNADQGFDIYVTEDGENWDLITNDGLGDPYNYGARTFTVCDDQLYVGTANPYYGAQLWNITGQGILHTPEITVAPEAREIGYNGKAKELVTEGSCENGTIFYALGENDEEAPAEEEAWATFIPKGVEIGTYYVWYKVLGDAEYRNIAPQCLTTNINVGIWEDTSAGRKYTDGEGWYAKNQWLELEGKWYYFDKSGIMEADAYRKGWYLTEDGSWDGIEKLSGWKQSSKGWWYSLSDGTFLAGQWKKIDGVWYYFKQDGYMAANEYVDGYYLNPNGAWKYKYKATWKQDSKGWYFSDSTGWYAKNETWVIDGVSYTFNAKGYCTNR